MRYISVFYIFLIFTQNFLFSINYCNNVIIDYSDYDFSVFSKGNHAYQNPNPVNGKRVLAFDYYYYLQKSFVEDMKANVYLSAKKIKENEKLKFKPGLVSSIINFFTSKESQLEKTLENKELSKILCDDDKFMEDVNEYRKDKAESSSTLSVAKKTGIKSLISGFTSSLLHYGKYAIYKSAESTAISVPYLAIIAIGVSVSIDIFEKLYNRKYNNEIEKNENEMIKSTKLYLQVEEMVKNLAWVENNVILTAVSVDPNCIGYKAQFDYNENIKYKDRRGTDYNDEIIKKMIELTCLYKSNICNETVCNSNLSKYTQCIENKRNGITKECPLFNYKCELI